MVDEATKARLAKLGCYFPAEKKDDYIPKKQNPAQEKKENTQGGARAYIRQTCPNCKGTGREYSVMRGGDAVCNTCSGKGETSRRRSPRKPKKRNS